MIGEWDSKAVNGTHCSSAVSNTFLSSARKENETSRSKITFDESMYNCHDPPSPKMYFNNLASVCARCILISNGEMPQIYKREARTIECTIVRCLISSGETRKWKEEKKEKRGESASAIIAITTRESSRYSKCTRRVLVAYYYVTVCVCVCACMIETSPRGRLPSRRGRKWFLSRVSPYVISVGCIRV